MKSFFNGARKSHLIPCPGPHWTLLIKTLVEPCPMEMQSSPVPMTDLAIRTILELLTWMPSVLGLFSGAVMWRWCALKLLQLVMNMWNDLLFNDLIRFTTPFVTLLNFIDCTISKQRRNISHALPLIKIYRVIIFQKSYPTLTKTVMLETYTPSV